MTERMDSEPVPEGAGNASASPELDLTTLPWLMPDDAAAEAEDAATTAPSARATPPPRRARNTNPEPTTIVGGAAAAEARPALPRRIITMPKPRPAIATEPLPSVIIPNATLPPRGRGDDERTAHVAEPGPADDGSRGRPRAKRTLVALGALTLAGLAAVGVARLRGGDEPPVAYSPPDFLNVSPPSAPPPSPATELSTPDPSGGAPTGGPAAEATAPPPVTVPGPAAAEHVARDLPTTPTPTSSPPVAETRPASDPSSSRPPATETVLAASETGAVGKKEAAPRASKSSALNGTGGAKPPVPTHGGRREIATPQPPPSARPRALTMDAAVDPITTYTFGSDELFRVQTAPKRVTDLILQPGEKLATRPSAGDASLWVVHVIDAVHEDEQQQHVQVTPLRAETTTNLTLTTNRRNYHLELISSGGGAYMAAVQWRYPEYDAERRRQELERLTRERRNSTQVADAKALRFDYSIRSTSGKPPWRPTMVFDDGAQTFIRFPGGVSPDPLPMLFVVRTGGTKHAEYVNYRVRGDLYVVDRVVDAVELRLPSQDGDEPQQVVLIQRSAQ